MLTYKQLLESNHDFAPINLDDLVKDKEMNRYSLYKTHVGYLDKTGKGTTFHKPIHTKIQDSGYKYIHKGDQDVGGEEMTYHTYKKPAGKYSEHVLAIRTSKGSGRVNNITHKTVSDIDKD